MILIYRPSGRAREYSPLALNIYKGCDHGCIYCFARRMPGAPEPWEKAIPRRELCAALSLELEHRREPITQQVLLSFTGDPYCQAERQFKITNEVLGILLAYQVPVAILTKGGDRCLDDVHLFKRFERIKVGATLTFLNEDPIWGESQEWEPGAADPQDRLDTLKALNRAGIRTWASFEPVLDPEQSLELMRRGLDCIDEYAVGRWNHDPRAEDIDWLDFAARAVAILRKAGKPFYIKADLRKSLPVGFLRPEEADQDALLV